MKRFFIWIAAVAVAPLLALGCAQPQDSPADSAEDATAQEAGHVHTAPRGGTLVELGDHEANIEFVYDAAEGRLHAYFLDGHAENPVRTAMETFVISILGESPEATETLTLTPQANELTGEAVGDTSEFATQSDSLKRDGHLSIVIGALELRGATYEGIEATVEPAHADAHDH